MLVKVSIGNYSALCKEILYAKPEKLKVDDEPKHALPESCGPDKFTEIVDIIRECASPSDNHVEGAATRSKLETAVVRIEAIKDSLLAAKDIGDQVAKGQRAHKGKRIIQALLCAGLLSDSGTIKDCVKYAVGLAFPSLEELEP